MLYLTLSLGIHVSKCANTAHGQYPFTLSRQHSCSNYDELLLKDYLNILITFRQSQVTFYIENYLTIKTILIL